MPPTDLEVTQLLIDTFDPRRDVYAQRWESQAEVDRYNRWLVKQTFYREWMEKQATAQEKRRVAALAEGRESTPRPLQHYLWAELGGYKPAGRKGGRHDVTPERIARHVAGIETLGT